MKGLLLRQETCWSATFFTTASKCSATQRSSVEFAAGTWVQNFSLLTSVALSSFPESHHAKVRSTSQEAPSLLPEVHTSALVDSIHQYFTANYSDSWNQCTAIVRKSRS